MSDILSEIQQSIEQGESSIERGEIIRVDENKNTISIHLNQKIKLQNDSVLIKTTQDFGKVVDRIYRDFVVRIDSLNARKYPIGKNVAIKLNIKTLNLSYLKNMIETAQAGENPIAKRVLNILEFKEQNKSKAQSVEFFSNQLNNSQKHAIEHSIGTENFHIIIGPPGTGKTHVITEIVRQLVKRKRKTLVTAYTNLAVDNIAERVLSDGIDLVRIGTYDKTNEKMKEHHIDNLIKRHLFYGYLESLKKHRDDLYKRIYDAHETIQHIQKEIEAEKSKIDGIIKELKDLDQMLELTEKQIKDNKKKQSYLKHKIQKVRDDKSKLLDEIRRLESSTNRLISLEKFKRELNLSESPTAKEISKFENKIVECDKELSKFIMKLAFFGKLKAKKERIIHEKEMATKIINYHLNLSKEIEYYGKVCSDLDDVIGWAGIQTIYRSSLGSYHFISYITKVCNINHEPESIALLYQKELLEKYDNILSKINSDELILHIQLENISKLSEKWISAKDLFSYQKILLQKYIEQQNKILKNLTDEEKSLKNKILIYEGRIKKLSKEIYELKNKISKEFIEKADVIATTTHSSASSFLNMSDFDIVVMDEASQ
ncbi:MAG: AAA domain-containing protein, partial [Methanosarcinales archaeon]